MAIRFLLDENVPAAVLRLLKKKRFNATIITSTSGRGLTNGEVTRIAISENRIIVTLDSDFLTLQRELLVEAKVI